VSRAAQLVAAARRAPLRTLPRRALLRARYGPSRTDASYLETVALAHWRAAGAAPLAPRDPAPGAPLDVAFVVPPAQRGSGGHTTLANLVRALERRGHRCSLWLDDPGRRIDDPAAYATDFASWFGPFAAPVRWDPGTPAWGGADVVVATSHQTVLRARTLPGCGARAYLVQDHEPEFFATSAEHLHAAESYAQGFHAITAGTWLADLMRERYGLTATPFELAVDRELYRPAAGVPRRGDVVAFYARSSTPRRAVPIALAALRELRARRPGLELQAFGQADVPRVDFPVTNLGVLSGPELARTYSAATVGLCLSLTNYALVPQEMLACGLPCVEAATPSVLAAYGTDGPVALAAPEPAAVAAALERLLDDPAERARRVAAGQAMVAGRTWDVAGAAVEQGLRAALAARAG
jgi:glycosyltransferase involved in cell wall biosynthesis